MGHTKDCGGGTPPPASVPCGDGERRGAASRAWRGVLGASFMGKHSWRPLMSSAPLCVVSSTTDVPTMRLTRDMCQHCPLCLRPHGPRERQSADTHGEDAAAAELAARSNDFGERVARAAGLTVHRGERPHGSLESGRNLRQVCVLFLGWQRKQGHAVACGSAADCTCLGAWRGKHAAVLKILISLGPVVTHSLGRWP